jgi:hypothetical protein
LAYLIVCDREELGRVVDCKELFNVKSLSDIHRMSGFPGLILLSSIDVGKPERRHGCEIAPNRDPTREAI